MTTNLHVNYLSNLDQVVICPFEKGHWANLCILDNMKVMPNTKFEIELVDNMMAHVPWRSSIFLGLVKTSDIMSWNTLGSDHRRPQNTVGNLLGMNCWYTLYGKDRVESTMVISDTTNVFDKLRIQPWKGGERICLLLYKSDGDKKYRMRLRYTMGTDMDSKVFNMRGMTNKSFEINDGDLNQYRYCILTRGCAFKIRKTTSDENVAIWPVGSGNKARYIKPRQ
jgi:hypothetical protein